MATVKELIHTLTLPQLIHDLENYAILIDKKNTLETQEEFQKYYARGQVVREEIIRRFNTLENRLNEEINHSVEY